MARTYLGLTTRQLAARFGAVTLAGILYMYAQPLRYGKTIVTSAKTNAQRHREADGGQISWRNETLRRHGVLKRPEEGLVRSTDKKDVEGENGEIGESGEDVVRRMAKRK